MADLISLRTANKSNFGYYIKLPNSVVIVVGLYFFLTLVVVFLFYFSQISVISSAQLTALWLPLLP